MSDVTESASFTRVRQIDHRIRPPPRSKRKAIVPPAIKDIVFHKRNVSRSQYYFTSGHEHLGKARNVNDEQSPFFLPATSQLFPYARHRKDLSRREDKASYKDQRCDILRRLHVDVELEQEEAKRHKDPSTAMAMSDIDPRYFEELRGRVVKEHFSLRQYIQDTRDVLKTRLLAGQERDDCIRIDQQFDEEQRRLNEIKRRYREYVNGFEEYLAKDHEESMAMLREAEEETRRTESVTSRRNQLSKEFGQVRLDVYYWEEAWRTVKTCQRFLYRVSPVSWRAEHDWTYRSDSGSSLKRSVNETDLYRDGDDVDSLDASIETFEREVENAATPEMYFEDPLDLIRVFRTIELQNLNALIHLESLAAPMAEMSASVKAAEAKIQSEVDHIVEGIRDLESAIERSEKRARELEEYANELLHGVFRDYVCSKSVLHLRVFVEDTFESCVAPNDANLDSFAMMKSVERVHEELNVQLDDLPQDVVRTCEKEGFRLEAKAMKEAQDAARKLDLMHRLMKTLMRVMEPPKAKTRQPVWRSAPIRRKVKPAPTVPLPTEEELQFLTFFTDYCQQEDHLAYRSLFPDDFDLTFKSKHREMVHTDDDDEEEEVDDTNDDESDIETCEFLVAPAAT